MRDYVNPLVLLVVVALLACRVSGVGGAATLDVWLLTLCVTAFIADAALALARSMTHRRALMSVVWAVVFMVLGSCVWVMRGAVDAADEELATYFEMQSAYRQGADPLAVDEEGDCLFTVAASLGGEGVVRELLQKHSPVSPVLLAEAGRRAAENGKATVLQLLLDAGLPADVAVESTTLLCAAAQNARLNTMKLLLERGASPDKADAEGTTPLMHAVMADFAPAVRLLLQAGANASAVDGNGRDAASYSRSAGVSELLPPTPES